MDNAVIRYIFDRKKCADNARKTGLLQIEVRLKGTNRCACVSTGIRLYKNQFSDTNGFTCKSHPNAAAISAKARRIFTQVEAFVLSDGCRELSDVRSWNAPTENTDSFIRFVRAELARKNISDVTARHHHVLIRQLERFGKMETFCDITLENIRDFDLFLRQGIKAGSTLHKRHTSLKYYIKEAVNRDLIRKNPYDLFKMPSRKSKEPVWLSEDEVRKIIDWQPVNEKLEKVKDIFVFQIFTGLSYIDLMNFDRSKLSDAEGYRVVRSSRTKTDESFISLFLPEAERIAEKYGYCLPAISNQKYNDYLKLVGAGAGISKPLTSHVARHTYATYLLNNGIPIETVSRAMGHTNIKQTQHYARLLGKKVIEDMKVLLKK